MHIVINGTSARTGGGVTVLRNLIPAMLAADEGRHRYSVATSPQTWERLAVSDPRVVHWDSRLSRPGLGRRLLWEELEVPLRAAFARADVVLSPGNVIIPLCPVPQVLVYQNMAPHDEEVLASYHGAAKLRFSILRRAGVFSGRRAKRVVFISDFAKRIIGGELGIPAERMSRIYLGRDEAFSAAHKGSAVRPAALQGRRYFLSVSHFYRYKKFDELVRGFALAMKDLPTDVDLVIAGAAHEADYAREVEATIARLNVGGRVHVLGNVKYEQLPGLYADAELFLFPSSCENFPNILIEGLASGVPTLSSRLASMPEIAGDSAEYFDPRSPEDIARAIGRVWGDEARKRQLAQLGPARASRYSWAQTGREFVAVLEAAARG